MFRGFRQFLVAFGDCVTSEGYSGLGVQDGDVMKKAHYVAHSSQGLVKSNLIRLYEYKLYYENILEMRGLFLLVERFHFHIFVYTLLVKLV